MKYYLIAGEASGDLHASRLMHELRKADQEAQFRFIGGDLMREQGGTLLCHYSRLAYMGVVPVVLHLGTILKALRLAERDIREWQPHALILVDYPGFNLKVAKYVRQRTAVPIFYYIAPKLWAWKEYRIRYIKRDISRVYSILPFEVDFFERKHHCPIDYVGNPSLDEVNEYLLRHPSSPSEFRLRNQLSPKPIVALLPGSRRQEIRDNLPLMLRALEPYANDYQAVVAGAPGFEEQQYQRYRASTPFRVVHGQTYQLLQHAEAALVTSGTATLETALLGVPQVVCYNMRAGWLANLGRRLILKVPYISLVNLIAQREVVPELVAARMTVSRLRQCLASILPGGRGRQQMLEGYRQVRERLGEPGAPEKAALLMTARLREG
ncbi:MAG: lipid-A-disaccharide synthase [Prevotellaceae bacterium]|nr:lipid-A-disaccharide synthase [Prevotellaceae bacterium]